MSAREYLRFEGGNSVVLGLALVVVALALGEWDTPWLAGAVALGGGAAAWWAGRRTVASAVAAAGSDPPQVAERAVRREVLIETVGWVVAVTAWVAATGSSAELIAGTGAASAVFGASRMTADTPDGLRVAERGFFRTPRLTRGA